MKHGAKIVLKNMRQRAQSALEYLMSYGWGLIVVAVIIGVLIYVISGSFGGVVCQSKHPQIIVKEWVFASGDDSVGFTLQNATGGTITFDSDCVSASDGANIKEGGGSDTVCSPTSVSKAEVFTVQNLDSGSAGSFDNATATISYRTAGGLPVNANVVCSGTATGGGTAAIALDSCGAISEPGTYDLSIDLSSPGATCITVSADNVTLDCKNHSITGSVQMNGIVISSGLSNVTVKNCIIDGFQKGITSTGGASYTITGNSIRNSPRGIYLRNLTLSTINGNDVANASSDGIFLDGSSGTTISGNTINNAANGIKVISNTNCTVSGNTITGASTYGIFSFTVSNVQITGNTASNGDRYGFSSINDSGLTLGNNTFCGNGIQDIYCSPAGCCSDGGGNTANAVNPNCGVTAGSC